jgi:hypothetical protein
VRFGATAYVLAAIARLMLLATYRLTNRPTHGGSAAERAQLPHEDGRGEADDQRGRMQCRSDAFAH